MRTYHGSDPAHTRASTVDIYPYFHWSTINFTYDVARDPTAWTSETDPRQELFDEIRLSSHAMNDHQAPETAEHWHGWVTCSANTVSSYGKWSKFTVCVWDCRSPWTAADSNDPARLNEKRRYSELKEATLRVGIGCTMESVNDGSGLFAYQLLRAAETTGGEGRAHVMKPFFDLIQRRSRFDRWMNAADTLTSKLFIAGRTTEVIKLINSRLMGVAWHTLEERGYNDVSLHTLFRRAIALPIDTQDPRITAARVSRARSRLRNGQRYLPTRTRPSDTQSGHSPTSSSEPMG